MASAFVAGLALVACGGDDDSDTGAPASTTNGVEQLSATEILDKAKAAAVAAGSVHVSGEVVQDEGTFGIDMRFGADGSTGTMTFNGAQLELLRVGADVYMKATGDTWNDLTGQQGVGELIADRYVKVPAGDESFGDFTSFLSLESFIDGVLDPTGELEKGTTTEVRGAQAIGVVDTDKEDGGTVYIALTGEPLPLRIQGAEGSTESAIDFLDWGKAMAVTAPAEGDVVDLSELMN
ncbi:MAG: hypothetical protein ACRDWG_15815 [Actinomycetes bacterium]